MIALELAPRCVRGIRGNGKSGSVEIAFADGDEKTALRESLRNLGGSDEIRIVLSGISGITSIIVEAAPDEIGPISQHVPVATKDIVWRAMPISSGAEKRSLLMVAVKSVIEEELDRWGLTAGFRGEVSAVAPLESALVAAANACAGDSDILFCGDGERILLRRRGREVIGIDRVAEPTERINAKYLFGPKAAEVAARMPGAELVRPGKLDPAMAAVYGASLWGTTEVPYLPDIEPAERKSDRRYISRRRRSTLIANAVAGVIVALSIGFYLSEFIGQSRLKNEIQVLDVEREAAVRKLDESAAVLSKGDDELMLKRGEAISILSTFAGFAPNVGILEMKIESSAGAYPALESASGAGRPSTIVITGRAKTLDMVENIRRSIEKSSRRVEVNNASRTGEPELPILFEMRIR